MVFHMTADVEFEADNIDDAFEKLRDHFDALVHEQDSDLIQLGSIDIEPKE